jgi:hypothetical protein
VGSEQPLLVGDDDDDILPGEKEPSNQKKKTSRRSTESSSTELKSIVLFSSHQSSALLSSTFPAASGLHAHASHVDRTATLFPRTKQKPKNTQRVDQVPVQESSEAFFSLSSQSSTLSAFQHPLPSVQRTAVQRPQQASVTPLSSSTPVFVSAVTERDSTDPRNGKGKGKRKKTPKPIKPTKNRNTESKKQKRTTKKNGNSPQVAEWSLRRNEWMGSALDQTKSGSSREKTGVVRAES